MSETTTNKEEKGNSLLPSKVIINQVPAKYEIHTFYEGLESSSSCANSRTSGSMNSETEYPLSIDQKICNGLYCYEKMATVIKVPTRTFGMIKLCLCNNCSSKFPQKRVIQ